MATDQLTVSVFIGTSLDGFIARVDGSIDWLDSAQELEGEDYGYEAFMDSVDAVVMGRNSFETVLGFGGEWPYPKPVVVLTSRHLEVPSELAGKVSTLGGEPEAIVAELASRGMHSLYLDGGSAIQRFLRADLVDRMILTRLPILLGTGIPLFGALDHDVHLEHIATRAYPNGLVQSEYRMRGVAVGGG